MKALVNFLTIITSILVFGYYFLYDPAQFEKSKYETTQTADIYEQQEDNSSVETEVVETEVVENNGSGGPEKVYSEETKRYFNEIALKTEFQGDRESVSIWTTDMKIFVDGEKPEYLMDELQKIVGELNDIINPINIKIVTNKNESNYVVYFGSHTDFKNKYKLSSPQHLDNNWGFFQVNTNTGKMYVDLYRNNDEVSHKHLLREELTQSLGLFNDTWDYPESIFYKGWTTTTEFAQIDRELIDMLYNN
jgi:hypothetical protein